MKKSIIIFCITNIIALPTIAQNVQFSSANIEAGIRRHLGIDATTNITIDQIDTITHLDLSGLSIRDIRDIGLLSNVKYLDLSHNEIDNVAPLVTLDSLRYLNLKENNLESINMLSFSYAKEMWVDVSFNHIMDFSCFKTLTHCNFTIDGIGLQKEKNAPYFNIYQLYSEVDASSTTPKVSYRGYTNMEADVTLQYASTNIPAVLDGNYNTVEIPDVLQTPTKVFLTNGERKDSTWMIPEMHLDIARNMNIDIPLPEDYSVGYAGASNGTVEVEGRSLKYVPKENSMSDVIEFNYYRGSKLRGSSYCTLTNKILPWQLKKGWNWVSHSFADAVKPNDVFGQNVVEVKNQTRGLIYDTKYGMVGNLTELVASEFYKVKTSDADTEPYLLTGYLFDAESNAINLREGWNWIGYPMANEATIEEALKNFSPKNGDMIVGQDYFTTYVVDTWVGQLEVLTPGKGYMYKSGEAKPLHFNSKIEAKVSAEANMRRVGEETLWTCDIYKYPNRMPTTVCLYKNHQPEEVEGYDVAAFCGEECRAVGKVVKGVVMMNVCGEGDEIITFKAIDKKSGIVMDIKESVPFSADVLGEYTEPFRLTLSGDSASGIEIVHSSQFAVDNEIIYNVAGQRAGTLQQGVNIIRMKDGKTKKVQVK